MKHEWTKILRDIRMNSNEIDGWNSLRVTYEAPRVDRMWRPYSDGRLMLHRIWPETKRVSLYHPHPWPSQMLILDGNYEMRMGTKDLVYTTVHLAPESSYEMHDHRVWHDVTVTSQHPVLSVMVTGPLYGKDCAYEKARAAGEISYPETPEPELQMHEQINLLDDIVRQIDDGGWLN